MFGWVIVSRLLLFHIYYLFVDYKQTTGTGLADSAFLWVTNCHLPAETLGGDVRWVERLDFGVVEQQPAVVVVVLAVANERVVVPAVGRARVHRHTNQFIPGYTNEERIKS
jgi:hypothetical protein